MDEPEVVMRNPGDDREAFQLGFGAYRCLARVLFWPLCRHRQKHLEKYAVVFCTTFWYAPNPGSKKEI